MEKLMEKMKRMMTTISLVVAVSGLLGVVYELFLSASEADVDITKYAVVALTGLCGSLLMELTANRLIKQAQETEMEKLSKLLEYSKKRKEIEEEISRLTNELTTSDMGEFIDVNRLIFQGQRLAIGDGAINYEGFLSQFGIHKSEVQRQKDFVVFLTPFTDSAAKTYRSCVNVLNEIGIHLQRTDNVVEKSDIMMNIVTQIVKAEFVIANIDGRNPNVYYELGIAHAIGKPTILISNVDFSNAGIEEDIGFDVRQKQIVLYRDEAELEKKLLAQISRIRSGK